jgi:hypothetical protein
MGAAGAIVANAQLRAGRARYINEPRRELSLLYFFRSLLYSLTFAPYKDFRVFASVALSLI